MRSILVCPDDFLWRLLAQTGPSHFEALYVVEVPQARARIAQRGGTVLAGDLERDAVYQRAFRTGHEPVLVAVDGPRQARVVAAIHRVAPEAPIVVNRIGAQLTGAFGGIATLRHIQRALIRRHQDAVGHGRIDGDAADGVATVGPGISPEDGLVIHLHLFGGIDIAGVPRVGKPDAPPAIDRQIVHYYEPGAPRNWELMNRILRGEPWLPPIGKRVEGDYQMFRDHVRFPRKLAEAIELRWRELGYLNLSCYLTALIRYDLLLSGPHTYFNADDQKHEDILAALDEETLTTFHAGKRQKILLDYLVESAAGRELTPSETEAELHRLATLIRDNSVQSQKAHEQQIAEERRRRSRSRW